MKAFKRSQNLPKIPRPDTSIVGRIVADVVDRPRREAAEKAAREGEKR